MLEVFLGLTCGVGGGEDRGGAELVAVVHANRGCDDAAMLKLV